MDDEDESQALVKAEPRKFMDHEEQREVHVAPAEYEATISNDVDENSIIRPDDPAIPPPSMDYPV